MAKKDLEERLEGIPQDELDRAQEKLNILCKEYGLNPIPLTHGKAQWRELCLRMIGLPAIQTETKSVGRPQERSDDENWEIGNHIRCLVAFSEWDDETGKAKKPMKVKEAIAHVAAMFGIESKIHTSKKGGTDKEQVVRGIYYNKFPDLDKKTREEWEKSFEDSENN